MRVAKAELVCLNPHVRLHHRRAHYVLYGSLFEDVPHPADGAALLRLENFVYGYCKNTFSHKAHLSFIDLSIEKALQYKYNCLVKGLQAK